MNIEKLGFNSDIKQSINKLDIDIQLIARVTKEYKERYIISTLDKDYEAEIMGNLRYAAKSREDFPAVGDWVEFIPFDENNAIIKTIIPRTTLLERKSIKSDTEKQIIATNIDVAFVVQSADRDFNLNRLERYISLIYSGSITPAIILNKTDLVPEAELKDKKEQIRNRFKNIDLITTSNITQKGIDELKEYLIIGKTYCFVGSSGVGKSSIINSLLSENRIKTNQISNSTNKGKHTTTNRELILLDNGSILIDTPGMREVGLTEVDSGIENTFTDIEELAKKCKFTNCTHTNEPGCAILNAVESGQIDERTFKNYHKLVREQEHFQRDIAAKRKKDKEFGKMIKNVLKEHKKDKF